MSDSVHKFRANVTATAFGDCPARTQPPLFQTDLFTKPQRFTTGPVFFCKRDNCLQKRRGKKERKKKTTHTKTVNGQVSAIPTQQTQGLRATRPLADSYLCERVSSVPSCLPPLPALVSRAGQDTYLFRDRFTPIAGDKWRYRVECRVAGLRRITFGSPKRYIDSECRVVCRP